MDWFRSWHGAPTDPKWLGIAKKAGTAPGIVAAIAWALMDRASQAEDRGSIEGYDADALGCFFGCEPEQVTSIVEAMTAKGMIVDGRFSTWEKRQPKREDDSSERVKRFRERKNQQNNADVTRCNADVTHGNAPEKIQIREEKKVSRRVASATAPVDSQFEEFWKAYPKRKGDNPRKSALKAFEAAVKAGADPVDIIAGVKLAAKRNTDKIGTEFIPQAVTWLHGERWKDHLAQGRTEAQGPDWRALSAHFKKTNQWPSNLGPQPGFSGCRVPTDVLREFGYLPADDPPRLALVVGESIQQ